MTMNRSVLVVNHGALSLAPRGIEADVRGNAQDIYSDADHVSSLSLSPPASKPTTVIPGMQEIFTRFSSPPHPSPILAATLGGYNSQSECYVNEMATTRTTSSCVTTPQSLYSDPINSAEGQSNFENSFEASSSSAIDLVDFPSSLMPNALDDFESLGCDPHADHLADEARQAIEGIQPKDCPIQLDDDEMDIVPNELVQFVSESTRRIRCVATSGLSGGDSDLDEMDHDARIASLCLPILQPPSLISSHVSDGMRPPSLSPQSPADGPLVAGNSDDLTAIEFTRAYLSEPADSRSTLSEPKDFETYHSIDPMNEFKTNSDPDVPPCESRTPENQQTKPEDSVLSRVTTRVVSAPVLGQSTPLSSSTQPSVTSSILPPGAVQLIAQSTVPSSTPSTFTSPQSSISFLLTTDLNKTNGLSSSLPPTQTTNRNALSYLNLPLQILQALPNLRPGMSILLNVKNERPPGQFGAATSVALESQLSPVFTNSTATTRSDNTVFLLPGSQIPITGTSKIQTPQGVPTQHACHLNSNLGQSVLFMPSVPSSGVSSLLLPCGLNSVPGTNPGGTTNGASSALAAGTQFLLLRSPKPELKIPGLVQASNVSPVTSEMTFLLSTNSTPKVQTKPSLLLIPTAVPSSGPQQTCLFPTITSPLNFQPANPNLLDNSTISSWGYRPPDLQSLLGLNSGSACLQFGVGQPTANVQNTLLAAALNRSISNNLTASTLTFPITVLPTSPQTLLMSPSTSVLQPSSSLNTLLPSPLASSLMSIATQTASMVTTDSSVSSANLDPTSKFPIAAQPGYPSTSIPSNPAPSNTLSTPGTMITCVPAATNNTNPSSVFPPKKLIVLPSADNLLSSCSRSSVLSGSTPTVSVACQQAFKNSDSKVPLLSSYAHRPLSPCVLPSPTGTTSTKSASPVPQSSTTSHVNCRRRHQCPYCPKSCERKDNLQAHIRTHTGERPYPCRFCPKAFPQKDHLRAHIRTHTGEKPYRCPQCMKAFAQLGNLHRHVKTHKR
ncbi:unnamed protein product [Echinostoma caproni]|uniref:Zinc finger protein n=1 Tax=Echinostoma caproni TaxID=27848 RepID=A0A183A8G8_9TREM|nr:unnamed protein product [Echinostoma caproni]